MRDKVIPQKIKLFFIINTFSAGGGAESLLTSIVNALFDTGRYDIGIMEIIHNNVKNEAINPAIMIYQYYTEFNAIDRKERMHYVYREWDKVISEYIPRGYDIYISFNYLKPSFLLPRGERCVAWIHGDVYNLVNRYPGMRVMTDEIELQRKAFSKAQVIVAISDNTRKSIIDLFPEYKDKICTIYNGIDVERVNKLSHEKAQEKLRSPAVIFIGRLEEGKDPLRALDIFERVHSLSPDTNMYYLGYGDLTDKVSEGIIRYGLEEKVHLLGYYDNPFPIIKQADVTIMTSKSEGFPMALLESVALGVPFVSTVVGGSNELAKYNCGITFEDDEEAVRGLIHFLSMEKNDIQKMTRYAISHFSMETFVSNIEELFRKVMSL
jgi:glycosyltransferase involved in cell wall biosynthesis